MINVEFNFAKKTGLHNLCGRNKICRIDNDRLWCLWRLEQFRFRSHRKIYTKNLLLSDRCCDQLLVNRNNDDLGSKRRTNVGSFCARWSLGHRRWLLANTKSIRKVFISFFWKIIFSSVGAAYGVLFTEHESAFSNFRLWESLGFVIAYVYTPRIRIQYAQIILLCVLTVSLICYGVIDWLEYRRKKSTKQEEEPTEKIEERTQF